MRPGTLELCNDGIDNDCNVATPDVFDTDGDGFNCDVDCRDDLATINPGQAELCADGADNDCDPATPDFFDADGDGYSCDFDCDDNNLDVNPGVGEVCNDGVDNDCNPATPDLFDTDADGSTCEADCDDTDPGAYPGGAERCDDGVDNDCDALIDLTDPDCTCGDLDGDGYDCATDCDESDPNVNPGALELCNDAIDNDCDPATPDLVDLDGDGYACDVDCDESRPEVNPGASEVCADGIDNDCEPVTPDIFDLDADTYTCDVDCDDSDAAVNPGAAEIGCDGIDNDCNVISSDLQDADGDAITCADLTIRGGGISALISGQATVTIVNNTLLQNNLPLGTGGAIWLDDLEALLVSTIANNIIAANSALVGGGIDHTLYSGEISRNDLFQNSGGDLYDAASSLASLSGNMFVDPLFTGPSAGNYRLDPQSPLIDAADPASASQTDVDGLERPVDGNADGLAVADLGAFEYPSGEVFGLVFVNKENLSWEISEGQTDFNLYRGELRLLRTAGIYTQNPQRPLVEQFCDIPSETLPFSDAFVPPAGEATFYLVTFINSRRTFEGTLGEDSSGALRPNDLSCP